MRRAWILQVFKPHKQGQTERRLDAKGGGGDRSKKHPKFRSRSLRDKRPCIAASTKMRCSSVFSSSKRKQCYTSSEKETCTETDGRDAWQIARLLHGTAVARPTAIPPPNIRGGNKKETRSTRIQAWRYGCLESSKKQERREFRGTRRGGSSCIRETSQAYPASRTVRGRYVPACAQGSFKNQRKMSHTTSGYTGETPNNPPTVSFPEVNIIHDSCTKHSDVCARMHT